MLKTLPDKEAQNVLRRLRQGNDVATIVDQIKAADFLLQLSVVPETRMRYELPYRTEMPVELLDNNPYLNSLLFEAASLYSKSSSQCLGQQEAASDSEKQSLYIKPFHAAEVLDPLLFDAQPSKWTAISNDDVLMRDLLSVFFWCEYKMTSAFQKNLFLEDMNAGREDFCSELLVDAVLGYACVC
jgi:hypothetical protein